MCKKILAVILTFLWVCALGPSASAQQQPTKPNSVGSKPNVALPGANASAAHPVEKYMRYRFFFQHLQILDEAAAKFEAQGKQTGRFRYVDQDRAHLTDAEGQAMKEVAYDCNRAVADIMAKRKTIIDSLRAQYPHTPLYKIALPPELDQLEKQRVQVINAHIDQLKERLGADSFQKLDNWVQSRDNSAVAYSASGPGVGVKAAQPPGGVSQ
jgi:hypothetical protein